MSEFELVTRPALEEGGISKKEVRNLYRRLGQCAYYQYDGNVYLVTHGGLSTIPDNLSLVATEQMMDGTGRFEDAEKVGHDGIHPVEIKNEVYKSPEKEKEQQALMTSFST